MRFGFRVEGLGPRVGYEPAVLGILCRRPALLLWLGELTDVRASNRSRDALHFGTLHTALVTRRPALLDLKTSKQKVKHHEFIHAT